MLRVPNTAKIAESKQLKKKSEISLNSSMFKMYAIICAVTVFECNTMYEDPPRVFDTKEQCLVAAQMKEDLTIDLLAQFSEALRKKYKITINDDVIDQLN